MKSITTLTSQAARQQASGQVSGRQDSPRMLNEDAARHVNDIFRALQAAFPAWRTAFPDSASLQAAKASWVKGLIEAGITDMEQIARGVRKARQSQSDFFPGVGKFIHWCKPSLEEFGLPTAAEAFLESITYAGRVHEHVWTHPGVYEAARRCGLWELRHCTMPEKTFAEIYQRVFQEVTEGAVFEIPAPRSDRLEHYRDTDKTVTEEQRARGKEILAELQRMLRGCK